MTITDDQKRASIAAAKGPIENELYAAELDLKVAKAGNDVNLEDGPKTRVDEAKAKLAVLDDEAKKI